MHRLWADKALRISGGLAVLILLTAEEKLCPWLLTPPINAASRAAGQEKTGSGREPISNLPGDADSLPDRAGPASPNPAAPAQPTGQPHSLWFDAVPVRSAGQLSGMTLKGLALSREGTVARGPLQQGANAPAWPAVSAWPHWNPLSEPPPVAAILPAWVGHPIARDPALLTSLMRTGPPGA